MNRTPPNSSEFEAAIIAACLLSPPAIDDVMEELDYSDFYSDQHCLMMKGIAYLHTKNKPVDLMTLKGLLEKRDKLDAAGGLEYLNEILNSNPTTANVREYAKQVHELALRRAVIGACMRGLDDGYREDIEPMDYATGVLRAIEEAIKERIRNPIQAVKESIRDTMKTIDEQIGESLEITGIKTGYPDLDRMTAGLNRKDLVIIAGRPSMGKSAIALNLLENAASMGKVGLLFSLEMSVDQLNRRLLASRSNVNCHKLRFPRLLDGADVSALVDASNEIAELPIYVDDSAEVSMIDIRARARRFMSKREIDLIVIDYLQIMRMSTRRETTRDREIAEVTQGAKGLAKELGIPVILLSQLNRSPENREDHRPRMSDLRESGAIEQDADLIMFLYREAAYKHEAGPIAEVLINKNRNGPCGVVKLNFRADLVRFDSLDETEQM